MRSFRIMVLAAVLLAGPAGCRHCCKNRCSPGAAPIVPGQRVQPGCLPASPMTPLQTAPGQAAPGTPGPYGPGSPAIPPPAPAPQAPPPPAPAPSGISGYLPEPSPPVSARWQGVPGPGVRLGAPESAASPLPRDGVRLQPPVVTETPPARPSIGEQRDSSPALPVGIPQFTVAREGVTSGLTPYGDGFDWLRTNGYRTVLLLHSPTEDTVAARKAVESRGLAFISLAVSPEKLPHAAEEFNRTVNHKPNHPLFVYDSDGLRTGSLWYLYFRVVDRLPDDAARRKAADLGLREATQGEAGTMWVAIQQYIRGVK